MSYRIGAVLLATSKHVTEDNPKSVISVSASLAGFLGFPRLVFSAMLGRLPSGGDGE